MPLVSHHHAEGQEPQYRKAISQGVQEALVETFNVPNDDLLPDHHRRGAAGRDRARAELSRHRLHRRPGALIQHHRQRHAHHGAEEAAVPPHRRPSRRRPPASRREDIFINLVEVKKENWSFGDGRGAVRLHGGRDQACAALIDAESRKEIQPASPLVPKRSRRTRRNSPAASSFTPFGGGSIWSTSSDRRTVCRCADRRGCTARPRRASLPTSSSRASQVTQLAPSTMCGCSSSVKAKRRPLSK